MQTLLDAVADFAALVPPTKVEAVASALRSFRSASTAPSPSSLVDTPAARDAIGRVLEAWGQVQARGDEVSGMLLGASTARLRLERELSVELVWTGPTTRFVPTRRTEQVLLDIIASATTDLFLVSFVAYEVPSVIAALKAVVGRSVRVRMLLEASSSRGGTLNYDPANTMRGRVPQIELFSWMERPDSFVDGKVHAKVAVVDGARAFITSANLTAHALERNMEAGVLIHGGTVPRALSDHLQALIDQGIIERV